MVRYDDATHTYWDGLTELTSVTTLLKKHGLAPDYSAVNPAVLEAAANKGKSIHKDIENFVNGGETTPDNPAHFQKFFGLCEENDLIFSESEKLVANSLIAGTVDLIGEQHGTPIIADIKTGQKINLEYCRWQLSLYDYLMGCHAEMLAVIHLTDDKADFILVDKIPQEKILELLDAEREGTQLVTQLPPELVAELTKAERLLVDLEVKKSELKEWSDEIKNALITIMQDNGIKKYENDVLSITYVAPQTRTTIDSAKLKNELPEVAEKYQKESKVGASVRVKIKEVYP